jgi:hypothetical protein
LALLGALSFICLSFCLFAGLFAWECCSVSVRFRFFVFDKGSDDCVAGGVLTVVEGLDIEHSIDCAGSACLGVRCGVDRCVGVEVKKVDGFDRGDSWAALVCVFDDMVVPALSERHNAEIAASQLGDVSRSPSTFDWPDFNNATPVSAGRRRRLRIHWTSPSEMVNIRKHCLGSRDTKAPAGGFT